MSRATRSFAVRTAAAALLGPILVAVAAAGPPAGPNAFVSDIVDVRHWGGTGGIRAYSLAAVLCNAGDQAQVWEPLSADHPLLAQNLFRLHDGRFEQIGLSWLKHALVALNQDGCALGCTPPPGPDLLGPGCSDLSSAGLSGAQQILGPRSEVDPSTGLFPFPHSGQGQTGDVLFKRLQVAETDLDPALNPGARYFLEAQVVAPDDAAAGNGADNASYREVVVQGGSFDLAFTAEATRAGMPAILAWQEADPEVAVASVEVPGDGRFLLAARVTELGDGNWQYEYAVQNLDSHRAAGAFAVPVGDGATTALGFHDIAHHSGEPWDDTDWSAEVSGGFARWATVAAAIDPNANALRWGTLYNFRLVADRPSVAGRVELSLFLDPPGTLSVPLPTPALAFFFGDGFESGDLSAWLLGAGG